MGTLFRQVSIWLTLVIGFTAFAAQALTELQVSVDKNPVLANESFVLTITANDDVSRSAIDTSVLLKDFVVGQTRVSSSTQSINFKTTRTTSWITVLIARKPGQYLIPEFEVDGVRSKPIRLSVMAEQAGASDKRDVYMKNQLFPERVYPGQTAVLETKLYLGQQLERGSLTDPEAEQASLAQMGEDSDKVDIVNGRRYQVITRRYAVTSEQAGELTLRPPMFSGTLVTAPRRSLFDNNRTRPVQVVSDDLTLDVMPIPDGAPSPFIPAEYITLEEQVKLPKQITVGEPITRTIAMIANGVGEALLPALPHQYGEKVNLYPDKVDLSTSYQGKSTIAQRIESAALIATEPGTLVLPEIRVPYWDTRYHIQAEAVLPAHTIEVLPAALSAQEPEPAMALPQQTEYQPAPSYWIWLAAAFAGAWLLTLIAWWRHVQRLKRTLRAPTDNRSENRKRPENRWRALQQAISDYPNADLTKPLSAWLKQQLGVNRLDELADSPEKQDAIKAYQQLQGGRFAQSPGPANGEELLNALQQLTKPKQGAAAAPFKLYQ